MLQERWCQTELASSTLGCRTFNSSMRQQAAAGKLTMPLGKVGSTKQWQCIWVRLDSVILLESNLYLFDIYLIRGITPSNNLISAYKCIKSRFLSGIGCCPFLCVSRLSVSGTGRVRAWAGPYLRLDRGHNCYSDYLAITSSLQPGNCWPRTAICFSLE